MEWIDHSLKNLRQVTFSLWAHFKQYKKHYTVCQRLSCLLGFLGLVTAFQKYIHYRSLHAKTKATTQFTVGMISFLRVFANAYGQGHQI